MMTWYYGMVILCSILTVGLTDINKLVATSDCICADETLMYECTVVGGNLTFWSGTVITAGCEITLIHSRFTESSGDSGICNNGAVVGQSIDVVDNCYRSQLTIFMTSAFNGRTVSCSVDDGMTVTPINTTTLLITREPFLSPSNVQLVNANPTQLTFNWIPPNKRCPSLTFIVASENCGTCQNNSASLNTTCTNFTLASVCKLKVYSEICGSIVSLDASNSITVNLTAPRVYLIESIPYYSNREDILLRVVTNFSIAAPLRISDEIIGLVNRYNITYMDSSTGTICRSAIIPVAECGGGFCTDVFEVCSSSCHLMTNINITLLANYTLGELQIYEVTKGAVNSLVEVTFVPHSRSIQCLFLNQPLQTNKKCSGSISYGTNCNITLMPLVFTDGPASVLTTPPINFVSNNAEYCFEITASSDDETVVVEGTLNVINTIVGENGSNIATIVIIILLVLLVSLIVICGFVILCCHAVSIYKARQ